MFFKKKFLIFNKKKKTYKYFKGVFSRNVKKYLNLKNRIICPETIVYRKDAKLKLEIFYFLNQDLFYTFQCTILR